MKLDKSKRSAIFVLATILLACAVLLAFLPGRSKDGNGVDCDLGKSDGVVRPERSFRQTREGYVNRSRNAAAPQDARKRSMPSAVNENGFISTSIIELAGLSKSEVETVQVAFNRHRAAMSELIRKNVMADEARSNPSLGIRAFVIKPFSDDGRAEYWDFVSRLDSTIGRAKRDVILQGIPDTEFFSYGQAEVLVRLFSGDAAGNLLVAGTDEVNASAMPRAEVMTYDPITGKITGKSSCLQDDLVRAVGDIFPTGDD